MVGRILGHYRIEKKIASGGMGEVFVAEDSNLSRRVALKTLPRELASDPERRARLAREAKAIAALNHPNIVTVYSVERVEDTDFITMELVQGRPLSELIPRGGLPLDKFFALAIPLVDAVGTAHQHGILHRDLKPGNVMVSGEGRVKVLDFGLAKTRDANGAIQDQTITAVPTIPGQVLGTPAYMSPEQAAGTLVDARSDVFSLGVTLYEMLSGHRPFTGDTPAFTIAAIVKDTPRPLGELNPNIPRDLARAVHRCLAKEPIDRYQTAIDLRHDLEQARDDFGADTGSSVERRSRRPLTIAVLAALAAVALVTIFWLRRSDNRTAAVATSMLGNAVQITSTLDVESHPTWSPDGQRLAYQASTLGWFYVGDTDIWVAQPGSGEPVNLTRDSPANDRMPSWSPDGRDIAFFSNRSGEWAVYVVPAIGGQPRQVLGVPEKDELSWSAPQWSADGTRLFVSARQRDENVVIVLARASLESTRVQLPDHEGNVCWDLSVRPDGGRFAYVEGGSGATDITRLWTVSSSGGDAAPLTDGRTSVWTPTWSRDGRAIFYVSNRGGTLDVWFQRVSDAGRPEGDPQAITQGLQIRTAAFSPDGRKLAYTRGGRVANVFRSPILDDRPATWADVRQLTFERAEIETMDVSPDGTTLALSSDRRGNKDLFLLSVDGGEMRQLTTDPTPDWGPRWSPDGKEIAFYAYRTGNRDVFVMPASGGPARQLSSHPGQDWFPVWSPDGREIAFESVGTGRTVVVNAQGGEPQALSANVESSRVEWSPDGSWLLVQRRNQLMRLTRSDGTMAPLSHASTRRLPANVGRFSRDGRSVVYAERAGQWPRNFWRLSISDGSVSRVTELNGRRGDLGSFATHEEALYFTWREDEGDIWVMDVMTPISR